MVSVVIELLVHEWQRTQPDRIRKQGRGRGGKLLNVRKLFAQVLHIPQQVAITILHLARRLVISLVTIDDEHVR